MYKPEDLKNLTIKPRINHKDLDVLQRYYELFLNPFIYEYNVEDQGRNINVSLRFDKENFCHLLGIESIAKYAVPLKELHNYKGNDGWNYIKKTNLRFKDLKKLNKKSFKNIKAKFVYFYLLPYIIEKPIAVQFQNENVNPPTKIDCDILFYTKNENAIIHLGIKKDKELGYYIPKTFFIEKVKEDGVDIYIENQKKINVSKRDRIILI